MYFVEMSLLDTIFEKSVTYFNKIIFKVFKPLIVVRELWNNYVPPCNTPSTSLQ